MEKKRGVLNKRRKKGMVGLILFTVSLLLLLIARLNTEFANWYAARCYPILVNLVGRLFSAVQISVAEVCLYILVAYGGIFIVMLIFKLIARKAVKQELLDACATGVLFVSVLFLIFTLGCGLNYQRISFSEENDMQTRAYTKGELESLCRNLTVEMNEWSQKVKRDENGIAVAGETELAAQGAAVQAMTKLGERYESLDGYYPYPKGLVLSEFLSYQNLSGIYSPFTIEANYNNDMVPYNIPFTMCHELSHLRGFMQEEEANFIAYLACKESGNAEFEYSGSMLAWIYSTNSLWRESPEVAERIQEELLPAVSKDLAANSAFWEQYQGKAAEVAEKLNDTYLKANGQNDGVKSYDRMVDLLIIYELDQEQL